MRLFVAVLPPLRVRRALAAAVSDVPRAELRWVDPAQWHVTLRFLGEVGDADGVGRALGSVPGALRAAGVPPVVATLGPATGWMAGGRVLQVPVAGLDALAATVSDAVAPWAAPADHPYRGHLTLARSRGRGRGGPGGRVPVGGTWRVHHVVLVASQLGPSGPTHRVVRRVRLPPAPPWRHRRPGTRGGPTGRYPCTNRCS